MAKKTYDVLKVNEYEIDGGEVKKKYINVGAAWELDKGGMSVQIEEGVSVTGNLVILARKPKDE